MLIDDLIKAGWELDWPAYATVHDVRWALLSFVHESFPSCSLELSMTIDHIPIVRTCLSLISEIEGECRSAEWEGSAINAIKITKQAQEWQSGYDAYMEQ
jgi:hypothetical protein